MRLACEEKQIDAQSIYCMNKVQIYHLEKKTFNQNHGVMSHGLAESWCCISRFCRKFLHSNLGSQEVLNKKAAWPQGWLKKHRAFKVY